MLSVMGDPEKLSRDDWEALLHAPFAVYSTIVAADEEATLAQFRHLNEELLTGQGTFADGSIGRAMAEAVAANADILWEAYRASGRHPRDVIRRAMGGLRQVPDEEAVAIRDWLLVLAVGVAEADRVIGEPTVSWDEASAIRELAGWLKRPMPDLAPG